MFAAPHMIQTWLFMMKLSHVTALSIRTCLFGVEVERSVMAKILLMLKTPNAAPNGGLGENHGKESEGKVMGKNEDEDDLNGDSGRDIEITIVMIIGAQHKYIEL